MKLNQKHTHTHEQGDKEEEESPTHPQFWLSHENKGPGGHFDFWVCFFSVISFNNLKKKTLTVSSIMSELSDLMDLEKSFCCNDTWNYSNVTAVYIFYQCSTAQPWSNFFFLRTEPKIEDKGINYRLTSHIKWSFLPEVTGCSQQGRNISYKPHLTPKFISIMSSNIENKTPKHCFFVSAENWQNTWV